MKIIKKIK